MVLEYKKGCESTKLFPLRFQILKGPNILKKRKIQKCQSNKVYTPNETNFRNAGGLSGSPRLILYNTVANIHVTTHHKMVALYIL